MKVLKDNNKLRTNMETESQSFGIGDMSIIMHMLTNMYSNPKKTLTQEYLCNARDAHREAGQGRVIEVNVPTVFAPTLKIRDFGLGLSPERIRNVFLNYGVSTKRDSNNQTGGFGIGGKSAWSYTDSFLIHSYFEGTKTTYAAINAENNPSLETIATSPASDPSGVCIEIAVQQSDVGAFSSAVFDTIRHWKDEERPVVTNATDSVSLSPTFSGISGSYYESLEQDYVCLDGILYPSGISTDYGIPAGFIIFAETGEVTVAPSREALIWNDKTRDLVKTRIDVTLAEIKADVTKQLAEATSLKEYGDMWRQAWFDVPFSYAPFPEIKGEKRGWGNTSVCYGFEKTIKQVSYALNKGSKLNKTEFNHSDSLSSNDVYGSGTLILFNDLPDETGLHRNQRIKQIFAGDNSISKVLLVDLDQKYHAELDIVNLSTIERLIPVRMPPKARAKLADTEVVLKRHNRAPQRFKISDLEGKGIVYLATKRELTGDEYDLFTRFPGIRRVSPKYIKILENVEGVRSFDDFVAGLKITEQQKGYIIRREICNIDIVDNLMGCNYTFVKYYDSLDHNSQSPTMLRNKYKKSKEYHDKLRGLKRLEAKLKEKCPLLKHISWRAIKEEDAVRAYINNGMDINV